MAYVYGENIAAEYPQISVSIERITPSVAEKMLEYNTHNRNFNRYSPARIALETDEFTLTSDAIAFSYDGVLLNGQHRLRECIRLQKPIDVLVMRGLDPDSQMAMDTGRKRTVPDYLKMDGYKDVNVLASIGLALMLCEQYGAARVLQNRVSGGQSFQKYTVRQQYRYVVDNYDKIKSIKGGVDLIHDRYKGLSTKTLAALFYEFKNADIESYEHFIGMLAGKYNPVTSVWKLRDILASNSESKTEKLTQDHLAALFIKAWNAYMRGEEISRLTYRPGGAHPESFPGIFRGWAA